jgi:hypothetical protein
MLAVSVKNVPLSQDHDLEGSRNGGSRLTLPSAIHLLDMMTYDISMNGLRQPNRGLAPDHSLVYHVPYLVASVRNKFCLEK